MVRSNHRRIEVTSTAVKYIPNCFSIKYVFISSFDEFGNLIDSNPSLEKCEGVAACISTGRGYYWKAGELLAKEYISGDHSNFYSTFKVTLPSPCFVKQGKRKLSKLCNASFVILIFNFQGSFVKDADCNLRKMTMCVIPLDLPTLGYNTGILH